MSAKEDFIWKEDREPHFSRRKEIMKNHPEIKKLFGIDKTLKYKVVFISLLQLGASFLVPENWIGFVLMILFIGSTLVHILVLGIHELTHNLAFKSETSNNLLGLLVNWPMVIPFAMGFKFYHLEHHWKQGTDSKDTDLPSRIEARVFRGRLGKFIWLLFQPFFYALRPLIIYPRKISKWELVNITSQVFFVSAYYYLFGGYGLLYMSLSLAFATGLHPLSGHFVSEHYVMKPDQETYSYYGPLNILVFNVGYHNEHHDFPNVPGSRLPELKRIAGKHYEHLHAYQSWIKVIYQFLVDPELTLNSRVKRKGTHEDGK